MQHRELCLWSERGVFWGFLCGLLADLSTGPFADLRATVGPVSVSVPELTAIYLSDQRTHHDGTPWVVLNMIASIDGAVAVDGVSGGLGNDADLAVFRALRSLADVILVAAGTARAERYGPPALSEKAIAERQARGQSARPVVAVVTRSLKLDLDSELFSTGSYRPTVVTIQDAAVARLNPISERADIVQSGHGDVNLAEAISELGARHGPMILVEGGPTLNGQLAGADRLDEVCLSVSPLLVGADSPRILSNGPPHTPRPFRLDRAEVSHGLLFTRYLRDR